MSIVLTFSLFFSQSNSKHLNQTFKKAEKYWQTHNSSINRNKPAGDGRQTRMWQAGSEMFIWREVSEGTLIYWKAVIDVGGSTLRRTQKVTFKWFKNRLCLVRQTHAITMPLYYWSKLILLSGGTDVFPSLLPDPQKISNANILLIHTHTRIWKPAFIYLSVHVAPISRDSIVRCFSSLLISKRFKIMSPKWFVWWLPKISVSQVVCQAWQNAQSELVHLAHIHPAQTNEKCHSSVLPNLRFADLFVNSALYWHLIVDEKVFFPTYFS